MKNNSKLIKKYLNSLTDEQKSIVETIRDYILQINNINERIYNNILMYRNSNWWVYINKNCKYIVLWFGKWNKMIIQNPLLYWLFDEIKKVVAKIYIKSFVQINEKSILELVDYAFNNKF